MGAEHHEVTRGSSKRISRRPESGSHFADMAAGEPPICSKKCERNPVRENRSGKTNDSDPPVQGVPSKHGTSSRRGIPSVLSGKTGDKGTNGLSAHCCVLANAPRELSKKKIYGLDPDHKASHRHGLKTKSRRRSSMDPPELNRGMDPSECGLTQAGNTAIQRSLNARRKRNGNRRKASGSFKHTELSKALIIPETSAVTVSRHPKKKTRSKRSSEPNKEIKIKGILKKRDAPPPIAYFGGTVSMGLSSSDEDHAKVSSSSDWDSDDEPDPKEKTRKSHSKDVDDKSMSSIKTGMRRGKYAAVNEAALSVTQRSSDEDSSIESSSDSEFSNDEGTSEKKFDRDHSHFLRTADLGMTQDTIFAQQFLDNPRDSPEPHFHHPTPHPPPGVQFHVDENWICVDDGNGKHSPIAPQAVDALVVMGFRTANDPVMWTPTSTTRKTMTEKRLRFDDMPIPGPLCEGEGSPVDLSCLIWHGKFPHKYYGSDIPAFRSQGIVNMSAEDLVELIMDSDRVAEYNRSSAGRTDEVLLSDGTNLEKCPFSGKRKKKLSGVVVEGSKIIDGTAVMYPDDEDEHSDFEPFTIDVCCEQKKSSKFVGVTKIVRSSNKVPLIQRTLQFTTLLHCRELTDEQGGNGYIIVARAVTPADDVNKKEKGVMRSEILLNVHIIRRLGGKMRASSSGSISSGRSVSSSNSGRVASKKDLANRCLMINVTHVRSPLIPKLLQKKIGLSAASSFMSDIRAANRSLVC